jgi:Bcr/CflA subfamily drug resistance transporter
MKKTHFTIFPIVLIIFEMATYLSNDMYLPALPNIIRDLQITSFAGQMTLTAWLLGSASLQLVMGPISDRFGRRPILLYGGMIFIVASALCALSNHLIVLLIARFFQGAVVCAVMVGGYATIHELLETEQAIKTLAWMSSIIILAPAFGPLLGSLILLFASWRVIFIILAVFGIFIFLGLKMWTPESLPAENRQSLKLKRIFNNYWLILRTRQFLAYTGTFCILFSSFIAWIVVGPLLVIRDFHLSAVWFGGIQVLLFAGFIIGTRVIKYLLPIIKVPRLLSIAMTIMLVAVSISVVCAILWPLQLSYFVATFMLFQFAGGLTLSPLSRLAIESVDQPMGLRMAVFSTFQGLFGVLGSVLASFVYNGQLYSLAWLIFILTACAFVVKFSFARNIPLK